METEEQEAAKRKKAGEKAVANVERSMRRMAKLADKLSVMHKIKESSERDFSGQNWYERHSSHKGKHHMEKNSPSDDLYSVHHQELKKRGLDGSQGPYSSGNDGKKDFEKTYLDGGGEFHSYKKDGKITHHHIKSDETNKLQGWHKTIKEAAGDNIGIEEPGANYKVVVRFRDNGDHQHIHVKANSADHAYKKVLGHNGYYPVEVDHVKTEKLNESIYESKTHKFLSSLGVPSNHIDQANHEDGKDWVHIDDDLAQRHPKHVKDSIQKAVNNNKLKFLHTDKGTMFSLKEDFKSFISEAMTKKRAAKYASDKFRGGKEAGRGAAAIANIVTGKQIGRAHV